MTYRKIHLFVSGMVQGVGFRMATVRKATELGLCGWVRNTDDDRVEVFAEGSRDKIEELLQFCHQGPRLSKVTRVDVTVEIEIATISEHSFRVRYE